MKRPIPEGVKPPEGCVILGWGKEFIAPPNEFNGWMSFDGRGRWLVAIGMRGVNPDCLYAADAGSEVARLNRDPLMDSVFGKDNCKGDKALGTECGSCERCKSYGWTQEDPRDGAIRGVTTDLERSLLALLFDPKYSDMSLDQIRTLATGYVTQGNNTDQTEDDIREFITDALKTPRLERR